MDKKKIDYNQSKYDYLYENNKNYMNYTALSFMPPKGKEVKVTYEELHDKIYKYANALTHFGIKKGDKVGVCVINTPESVYLLYALDKIGATVIGLSPLNNNYKMRQDLDMTRPDVVISVDLFYPLIRDYEREMGFSTILYSPIESVNNPVLKFLYNAKQKYNGNYTTYRYYLKNILNNQVDEIIDYPYYQKDDVTDIMFTGGSTGVHKGVELSSSGLNVVVQDSSKIFKMSPGMTYLGQIPIGHMVYGKMIMHYSLCNNFNFALTLKAMPKDFYDELKRTNPHGAVGGPIHWDTLMDTDSKGQKIINPKLIKDSLPNLKYASSGGEATKESNILLENKALEYCGSKAKLGNGFGITEMWSAFTINDGTQKVNSLGRSIENVTIKIVDPVTREEILDDRPGELHVSGPTMMLRYYQNEEETKKAIYYDQNGTKWFNTGDIIRRAGIGVNEYFYVGREKRNFVCGVDNIYPEQIEELLQKIPEIRESVVTRIPDDEKQNLPKYHISIYDMDNIDKVYMLEDKIENLIIRTLGESALPGYLEYYNEPLKRTDNTKIDVKYYQNKDLEELQLQKKMIKKRK